MKKILVAFSIVMFCFAACKKNDNNPNANNILGVFEKGKVYYIEEEIYGSNDTFTRWYNFGKRYSQTVGGVIVRDTTNPLLHDSMVIGFIDTTVQSMKASNIPAGQNTYGFYWGGYSQQGNLLYMDYYYFQHYYIPFEFRAQDSSLVSQDGHFQLKHLIPR